MHYQTRLVLLGGDFPDFFQADAVVLRIGIFVELELLEQALAQMPATAFGKQGVLGTQLHAGAKSAFCSP